MSRAPWPLIEVVIEPKSPDDLTLNAALRSLADEDANLRVSDANERGQLILGGLDETQLDRTVEALKLTVARGISVGAPQIAYRETLGRSATVEHTYRKHLGGTSAFARVQISFEPSRAGSGYRYEVAPSGTVVPPEYLPGVERGLEAARHKGLSAGFPVIDFTATLIDGTHSDINSSPLAFQIAAEGAFDRLREEGAPKLLEPIMKVEVTTPEDYVGDVIGELNLRRGQIDGSDQRGDEQVIIAMVPLANMFNYVNSLWSITQGRAAFHMEYDHYEAVPQQLPPDDTFPSAMALRA